MIKALIKERTINTGQFDAIQYLIYEYEEISGAVHAQSVLDAIVPMEDKELVGRQMGDKLLLKDPLSCYNFLELMGAYNKMGKLEDIRVSEGEAGIIKVGFPNETETYAEWDRKNTFENAKEKTYNVTGKALSEAADRQDIDEIPPAGTGDHGMYAYQPTTDFKIEEPKDEEIDYTP